MPVVPKELVMDVYRKQVNVYGRVLSQREFMQQTGIQPWHWRGGHWKRWSEFQAEAGFVPTPKKKRIPDEVLLRQYADLALRLHRLPIHWDLVKRKKEDPSFPGHDALRRLSRRREFLLNLEGWCEGKPEFSEVAAMLERRRIDTLGRGRHANRVRGFVYLARREKPGEMIYEIGREIGAGMELQRVAARIKCLPGAMHVIPTDDPEGIERYWRSRFRRRREKGRRYFRLFPEDVLAFRWRRYQ